MHASAARRTEYSAERTLYLAFDLGNRQWKLGFTTGLGQAPRLRAIGAGDLVKLQEELRAAKERFGLPEKTRILSCYEASRDGFWLARYLAHGGIENLVVDSASIEVNRRRRRAKTDRLDVGKLVTMLVRHHEGDRKVWHVVRVPIPKPISPHPRSLASCANCAGKSVPLWSWFGTGSGLIGASPSPSSSSGPQACIPSCFVPTPRS